MELNNMHDIYVTIEGKDKKSLARMIGDIFLNLLLSRDLEYIAREQPPTLLVAAPISAAVMTYASEFGAKFPLEKDYEITLTKEQLTDLIFRMEDFVAIFSVYYNMATDEDTDFKSESFKALEREFANSVNDIVQESSYSMEEFLRNFLTTLFLEFGAIKTDNSIIKNNRLILNLVAFLTKDSFMYWCSSITSAIQFEFKDKKIILSDLQTGTTFATEYLPKITKSAIIQGVSVNTTVLINNYILKHAMLTGESLVASDIEIEYTGNLKFLEEYLDNNGNIKEKYENQDTVSNIETDSVFVPGNKTLN